ncbi:hypothetical protein [Glutamicibacter nicotianae]|uniref:hypothetical protein n=1 Tax=Glutamicibacter nicotianae TaxID=37929 RepID=UPI002556B6CC|nr:hypothetical protein [Glutamicibacter nicotianae]WIV44540.1 hypothetical protein QQS42_02670 [Glutamicibacter nicotianae]
MSGFEEGIDPKEAPQTWALIQSWNQKMANVGGEDGNPDLVKVINALTDQNKELLLTLASLERAINREAGSVVTDK